MKKRILTLTLAALAATTGIAGCNLFGDSDSDTAISATSEPASASQENVGNVIEQDGVRKTVVYTDYNTGIEDETGPMEYSIDSVQIADVITTTDTAAGLLDLDKNTEAVMVTIAFSCKNAGERTANFYISQAAIEVNEKEEADPKSYYGEYVDGNFTAGVSKSGSNVYIIKNIKADDIKSIMFHVDAPADSDFVDMGDDVDVEIEID